MVTRRQVAARSILITALAASVGCGGARSNPSSPTVSVFITGLPAAVPYGSPVPLKAEAVSGAGASDCTSRALWQVDNLAVASISTAGVLTGQQSGFVTVTASCDGVSTSGRTMVQRLAPRVWVTTCDPPPSYDDCRRAAASVNAMIEFLEGPRAGEVMPEYSVASIPWKTLLLPIKIRVSARFYETREFVLSENTSISETGGDIAFVVPMDFVGDASTDMYLGHTNYDRGETFPFRPTSAGPIDVGTYWRYDDLSHYVRLVTELWCDGRFLARGSEGFGQGHSGSEFVHVLTAPSACEIRTLPHSEVGRYRLTITYAH